MWGFIFFIIKWIFIILSPFLISYIIHFLYYYFVKNMRFKQGEYKYVSHGSILKRLIIQFPKQLVIDRFNRDPDHFTEYGVHIIAGKQRQRKKHNTYIYAYEIPENVS